MTEQVAHACHVGPGNGGVVLPHVKRQRLDRLADHGDAVVDSVEGYPGDIEIPLAAPHRRLGAVDRLDAAQDLPHAFNVRGTHGRAASVSPFCLLYTSPSPRDRQKSRMPSSA